jgi:hypothetical protein
MNRISNEGSVPMEPQERVKKQEVGRTQPIRNWGVLFEQQGRPPPQTPPRDSVSHGVEMGYQVVEEYLRQGQNVARAMWAPALGGTPPGDGLQSQMGALLRTFADFASLWMGLMGKVAVGGAPAREPGVTPPVGTAGPFSAGAAPGPAESAKASPSEPPVTPASPEAPVVQVGAPPGLTLDLDSTRRTEVSVELRPRPFDQTFRVHDLRAAEPALPRIRGVTIEAVPEEERVAIRIRIPDDQPPGTYSGIILDERTGLPRGTLCVRVVS